MATRKETVTVLSANIEKRALTDRELLTAANLKRIWEREKANGRKLVQKEAAAEMGVKQSMISHYLNGVTALGTVATMKFSSFLRIRPTEIDPDFEFTSLVPGDLPVEAIEVAVRWMAISPPMKDTIRELILSASDDANA